MEILDTVFLIAVIVMSVVIHEVMHGVAADWLGDPTARLQGRLTLNPIPHLHLFFSIILPILPPLFCFFPRPPRPVVFFPGNDGVFHVRGRYPLLVSGFHPLPPPPARRLED